MIYISEPAFSEDSSLITLLQQEPLLQFLSDSHIITTRGTIYDFTRKVKIETVKDLVQYPIFKACLRQFKARYMLTLAIQHDILVVAHFANLSLDNLTAGVTKTHVKQVVQMTCDPLEGQVILVAGQDLIEVAQQQIHKDGKIVITSLQVVQKVQLPIQLDLTTIVFSSVGCFYCVGKGIQSDNDDLESLHNFNLQVEQFLIHDPTAIQTKTVGILELASEPVQVLIQDYQLVVMHSQELVAFDLYQCVNVARDMPEEPVTSSLDLDQQDLRRVLQAKTPQVEQSDSIVTLRSFASLTIDKANKVFMIGGFLGIELKTSIKFVDRLLTPVKVQTPLSWLPEDDLKISQSYQTETALFKLSSTGATRLSVKSFELKSLLQQNKPEKAVQYLQYVEHNPDDWLGLFMQTTGYLLSIPKALKRGRITVQCLAGLRSINDNRYHYQSVARQLHLVGLKLLDLKMVDEAVQLAIQTNALQLAQECRLYAKRNRDVIVMNLLDGFIERTNPGSQQSLVNSMTQLANFSQKQLKKEDFSNLYKDFDTLLKINDITDLELADFNSWELNLDEYQTGLDLEFQGRFQEAQKIYEASKITNDVQRMKNLQQELFKELSPGEQYLTFVDTQRLFENLSTQLTQFAKGPR